MIRENPLVRFVSLVSLECTVYIKFNGMAVDALYMRNFRLIAQFYRIWLKLLPIDLLWTESHFSLKEFAKMHTRA